MNRVCIVFFAASLLPAADWPSFRGPNASGIAEGSAPTSWDATKSVNIAWKTPIPGLAHSSPIVWGNKVFVTTAISSDPKSDFRHGLFGDVEPSPDVSKHTWKVYCLDRATGKILWERVGYEGVPHTKRHPKNSMATSTPVTDGKRVIAWLGSEGLYAYDMDGKLLWKQDLGVLNPGWFYDPEYEWGTASSPIIYKNLVIVQCDLQKNSFIAAFDVATGKQVWKTPRPEIPSWGTPTIYEGKTRAELITNSTKAIHAYDPLTGKELWTFTGKNSEITATTPIVAKDMILIANGYPPAQPIWAIRPGANGPIALKDDQESNEFVAWSKKTGGPYMSTVIAVGDQLYSVAINGVMTSFQLTTGERVYQQRISPQNSAHSGSPVYADGKLYIPSEDGDVFVVRAGPKFELLATNPMGEVVMSTPAISDGTIFIRGEHSVFAIREAPSK
jgi:outer membrane protein assembly factor BamB